MESSSREFHDAFTSDYPPFQLRDLLGALAGEPRESARMGRAG